MDNRLNKLLTLLNALPEQRIQGREYEPVTGTLCAFKGAEHVENFDFTCAMDDYQQVVTDYYNRCVERGLKASYVHARIAII